MFLDDENNNHRDPRPADPAAAELAKALVAMVAADEALQRARDEVPGYTGQWDPKDYYAQEQEHWNRAADVLQQAVIASQSTILRPLLEAARKAGASGPAVEAAERALEGMDPEAEATATARP